MEITQILGYLGALIIGIVLGLIGGGGSILTVPILVYLLSINPVVATAYSLFVVGVSSSLGAVQNIRKGLVHFKTGIVFAIPALIAVYITRRFIVPGIPELLFEVGTFTVTRDIGIMIFFAIIMLLASYSMIIGKFKNHDQENDEIKYNYPLIVVEGMVVGFVTGIVGAGGGFLIIPALVVLAKLPMKKAVATSLLIIAIKSLIGFIGDIETMEIDWVFLLSFTAFSLLGITIGVWLNTFINGNRLKRFFGWFVLVMGIYILINEIFLKDFQN